jgi:predicted regulator of Ras-like GTPase activity (Roadblock/LC7/MglB family)
MSKYSELKDHVDDVRRSMPELEGVLVGSEEGFPIVHSIGERDADRLAAMATAAQHFGSRVTAGLNMGAVSDIRISGTTGEVFIYSGGKSVLALITPKDGNAGLLHLEAGAMARKVQEVLG